MPNRNRVCVEGAVKTVNILNGEMRKLRAFGSDTIVVEEILGDGNCLVRAFIKSHGEIDDSKASIRQLRELIYDCIRSNLEEYEPALMYSGENEAQKQGLNIEQWSGEDLSKFGLQNTKIDGIWMGEEALRALSELFKVSIEVLTPNGSKITYQEKSGEELRTLKIFFNNNHYESVVSEATEKQMKKLKHKAKVTDCPELKEKAKALDRKRHAKSRLEKRKKDISDMIGKENGELLDEIKKLRVQNQKLRDENKKLHNIIKEHSKIDM